MAAIFSYRFPVAEERFKTANVDVVTLSNYEAVLEAALKTGYITEGDLETLKEWRKDPASWNVNK